MKLGIFILFLVIVLNIVSSRRKQFPLDCHLIRHPAVCENHPRCRWSYLNGICDFVHGYGYGFYGGPFAAYRGPMFGGFGGGYSYNRPGMAYSNHAGYSGGSNLSTTGVNKNNYSNAAISQNTSVASNQNTQQTAAIQKPVQQSVQQPIQQSVQQPVKAATAPAKSSTIQQNRNFSMGRGRRGKRFMKLK
jgi:hypothetical protein